LEKIKKGGIMPVCPECKYEYVKGVTICPDCGTALVDKKHFEKPKELSESDWEVVFTSNKDYEVEMMKDNLESAGMEANILSQLDRNFPAPGDFTVIKLLVKKNDVKEALKFIEQVINNKNSENENQE